MSTTTNFGVRRCITQIFNQEEEGADKPDKKRHRKDTLTDSEEKGTSFFKLIMNQPHATAPEPRETWLRVCKKLYSFVSISFFFCLRPNRR